MIGKLHLSSAYGRVETRTDDGYIYWQYSHAPRDNWPSGHDYADWVRERGAVLGDIVDDPDGVPEELHQTSWCAEKTIDFIRESSGSPWLASVNIFDPHPPFNPPKKYRERFGPASMPPALFRDSDIEQQRWLAGVDFQSEVRHPSELDINNRYGPEEGRHDAAVLKAAYYAMIALIDAQVGRILDAPKEAGQRENTVIIFTSDHGEMLGDHGLIQKGCRFYEGLVRVPLVISWPGHFRRGVVNADLVELTDIAPTFARTLRLAGARVDAGPVTAADPDRARAGRDASGVRTLRVLRRHQGHRTRPSPPCTEIGGTRLRSTTGTAWVSCTTCRKTPASSSTSGTSRTTATLNSSYSGAASTRRCSRVSMSAPDASRVGESRRSAAPRPTPASKRVTARSLSTHVVVPLGSVSVRNSTDIELGLEELLDDHDPFS